MAEPLSSPPRGYVEALEFLFARTTGASRLGLERTRALLAALGDPHRSLRALHIAGTNGKGSVAATLEALLRARGLRVGKYTSPHLVDFRERILVNGEPMPGEAVVAFIERALPDIERIGATFFEATTVMALEHLARAGVDVAVIETGLGGRLDATNVVHPLVAGITTIGFDHMEYLGDTLEQIAVEKAGICKPGVPAVIGEPSPPMAAELERLARVAGAEPVLVVGRDLTLRDIVVGGEGTTFTVAHDDGVARELHTPLIGLHQAFNAATALLMLEAAGPALAVSFDDAAKALEGVRLAGRFQRVDGWIFDVAHNPDGMRVVVQTLATVRPSRPLVALLCVLGDKDWRAMIELLGPRVDRLVLTQAPTAPASRAWDPDAAGAFARTAGFVAEVIGDFDEAMRRARVLGATVLVTGSFHTVGDALARLQRSPVAG